MKRICLLTLLVVICTSFKTTYHLKIIDLDYAIQQQMIQYTVIGTLDSPHYIKPISITLENKHGNNFLLKIPSGYTFTSKDTTYQDIIITKEEVIAVTKNKPITRDLYGMCIQKYQSAPNEEIEYTANGITKGKLNQIAKEIEHQNEHSILGQHAIWNITDDSTLYDIAGYESTDGASLRDFTADLLNVPRIKIEDINEERNIISKRTVGGNFRYNFPYTSSVTIGMFNAQDIIVKELFHNPNTPAGEHHLAYEFDASIYPDDTYYIRLIVNEKIKINFEMKPRGS